MNVWFGGDFHFGHKRIHIYRHGPWSSEEEHRKWVVESCNRVIGKRDTLFLLGDIVFTSDNLIDVSNIKGAKKFLVRGNHDFGTVNELGIVFDDVLGLAKYKEFWLSHAPIHPAELRDRVNLHGHVHYQDIQESMLSVLERKDKRYFNCCVENVMRLTGRAVVSLEEIREHLK